MKKIFLILFLSMFFFTFVNAYETAIINENTTVWCEITDNGIPKSVNHTYINLYEPDGVLFEQSNASFFSTGLYKFYFTPTKVGNWLMTCDFYNTTSLVGVASQSINVENGGVVNMEMFTLAVIFGIGISLVILGKYIGNYLYYFAGSVWFIINSFYALNTIPEIGVFGFISFVLVGIGSFWFAIDEVLLKKKELSKYEFD